MEEKLIKKIVVLCLIMIVCPRKHIIKVDGTYMIIDYNKCFYFLEKRDKKVFDGFGLRKKVKIVYSKSKKPKSSIEKFKDSIKQAKRSLASFNITI